MAIPKKGRNNGRAHWMTQYLGIIRDKCCWWCGCRLQKSPYVPAGTVALGGYGDNLFCGLRCGYQYGVRQAQLSSRPLLPSAPDTGS